jgi:hypothetical protein
MAICRAFSWGCPATSRSHHASAGREGFQQRHRAHPDGFIQLAAISKQHIIVFSCLSRVTMAFMVHYNQMPGAYSVFKNDMGKVLLLLRLI